MGWEKGKPRKAKSAVQEETTTATGSAQTVTVTDNNGGRFIPYEGKESVPPYDAKVHVLKRCRYFTTGYVNSHMKLIRVYRSKTAMMRICVKTFLPQKKERKDYAKDRALYNELLQCGVIKN